MLNDDLPSAGPAKESIKAFPAGLRMLAGDPKRRAYDSSDFTNTAISFVLRAMRATPIVGLPPFLSF